MLVTDLIGKYVKTEQWREDPIYSPIRAVFVDRGVVHIMYQINNNQWATVQLDGCCLPILEEKPS